MSKVLSYSEPVLFSALQKALGALVREDSEALSWPKPKPNIAHRLALHLDTACKDLPDYPATMQVDILTHQSDIIIHDRSGAVLLRILLSTTYLTQSQQAHLISFAEKEEANLVMGIAFLKETGVLPPLPSTPRGDGLLPLPQAQRSGEAAQRALQQRRGWAVTLRDSKTTPSQACYNGSITR